MIYVADISTVAQTLKNSPKKTVLKVNKGLVYKLDILFPPGSIGLLGCVICDGLHQVWPSTPNTWFRGDGDKIEFDDTYLKLGAPYEFTVYTYNLDDTYDHSVIVKIGIVSNEVFMARFLPTYTYTYFIDLLDKLNKEQEERLKDELSQPFSWLK